jgi:hypothetical protein
MRTSVFLALLVLCHAIASAQQTNCPTIEIAGPNGVTNPGETLTFNVEVGSKSSNLKYRWKTTHGSIEDGQGTQSIVVRATMGDDAGEDILASVTIEGLPFGCSKNISTTAIIADMMEWESWDEWGSMLSDNDQRSRLDSFFMTLANNPHFMGLFYVFAKPRVIQQEMSLILNHAKMRKFDKSRFIFALTDWDRDMIKLYQYRPGQWHKIDCKPPCKLIYGRDLK